MLLKGAGAPLSLKVGDNCLTNEDVKYANSFCFFAQDEMAAVRADLDATLARAHPDDGGSWWE